MFFHPDKDPARLEIKLLGTVEVILDGQRIRAFNSPRLHRFIALLVLDQRPQQRSKLAFQLWPDSGESQARTNLRKLLHELRRSLPDIDQFVAIDNETVSWKSNGPSNVDVLRFRNAVATGDLDLATRLYTGDLLPASYEDWVLEERECLRREIYETLKRLVKESISRADHLTASIRVLRSHF